MLLIHVVIQQSTVFYFNPLELSVPSSCRDGIRWKIWFNFRCGRIGGLLPVHPLANKRMGQFGHGDSLCCIVFMDGLFWKIEAEAAFIVE